MNSLIIKNLNKSFSQKKVLKDVNLVFEQNEIYALLGENGSGKTTLASIIYGLTKPDSGTIFAKKTEINDSQNSEIELKINSPKDALDNKIAYVYQNPFVSEENTCLENIFLQRTFCNSQKKQTKQFFFNRKEFLKQAIELAKQFDFKIDFNKKGKNLTADEKFNLAFLSALFGMNGKPEVLILDEPTASLSSFQKEALFIQLKKLKQAGCIVIFITHNKTEALENASKIVFLQSQKEPLTENAALEKLKSLVTADELLEKLEQDKLIHNRKNLEIENISNTSNNSKIIEKPFLSVKNLSAKESPLSKISNLSFDVFGGKLTCIKGMSETGLLLLENILSGMWQGTFSGKILLANEFGSKDNKKISPKILRENNVSIIPSNKIDRGSPKNLTVKDLLFTKMPKSKSELQIIKDAKVITTLQDKVKSLSGGMLQRLILERELSLNPKMVIFANPFYGLDIESVALLTERIENLLQNGVAVLVLSIDDELLEKRSDFFVLLNSQKKAEQRMISK